MARVTKREMLEAIRTKLNSQSFTHSGDREMDIVHAGNQVLRENKAEYHPGMFTPMIETLTAPMAQPEGSIRQTRSIQLGVTTHHDNGEISVQFEQHTYSVPTHRTKTERAFRLPIWTRSELDVRCFCQAIEWHRRFNPPVLPVVERAYTYHVNGSLDMNESRSLAVIAKARAAVAANEAAAAETAAALKAQRDEMRRENPPQKPAAPFVRPGSVGTVRRPASVLRATRTPWFRSNPPIMSLVAGGVR